MKHTSASQAQTHIGGFCFISSVNRTLAAITPLQNKIHLIDNRKPLMIDSRDKLKSSRENAN